jgi:hypothetical protein
MTTLLELWKDKKDFLIDKSLSQIINISGDGELKDGNKTSSEVRELLNEIPSDKLKLFTDQCLNDSFKDSGLALQDVINQFGKRLGFAVEQGLYRGKRNEIGFDGIWRLKDEHSFIVEIKTTDAYRINLDTIVDYFDRLVENARILKNKSSILIVVGRQDTGDLEAQIRGSKHAWNIRVLSIDALKKLLDLRETVNDNRVLNQINEILKPLEYTRLDKLIDLLFITSQDNLIEQEDIRNTDETTNTKYDDTNDRDTPVNYHEECIEVISKKLNKTFIKQSKSTYLSSDNLYSLTCAVSKTYPTKHTELFWYAFHPHQKEFLEEYPNGFVSFGCGDKAKIILIPLDKFLPLTNNMNMTTKNNRSYWHVKIHIHKGRFELEQPLGQTGMRLDITEYLIK